MSLPRKFSKKIVLIAFSDTHGDADRLARLYTLIDEKIKRDREKDPTVQHVLLVPGDVFSVNAVFSTVSKGQFDIDVISEIASLFPENHRFFTPGNHDFFYEEEALIKLVEKAKFRVVISNAQFGANSQLKFESSAVLQVGDERLILGGLMTPETLNTAGGRKVIKDEKNIDPCPEFFKQNPPDVLLSHLGSKCDQELPYQTIIVGGHTHDRQITKEDASKNSSLVINTGAGECIVVIHKGGSEAELIEAQACSPSPKILDILARYEKDYGIDFKQLQQTIFSIATDSVPLSGLEFLPKDFEQSESHLRINDSVITRETVDAIAAGLARRNEKVDLVLYPAAAIRTNFNPGQKISGQQLFETYYYSNKLAKLALSGAELIHLLALGVMSGYKCWNNRGQLLVPSQDLSYAYDINQENPGNCILWAKMKEEFINLEAEYLIVTTDWIAGEVKKLCPDKVIEFYPEELKIFKLVMDQLRGRELRESFGERITSMQSLKEQELLTLQKGNSRADKPSFDRYAIKVTLDVHRNNYFQSPEKLLEQLLSSLKGKPLKLVMNYAGMFFSHQQEQVQDSSSEFRSSNTPVFLAPTPSS